MCGYFVSFHRLKLLYYGRGMKLLMRTKSDPQFFLLMLHSFFKWRYERKARSGAYELPRGNRGGSRDNSNLGSYLSQTTGPYDLPRKRYKIMQLVAVLLVIALIAWIAYESIVALALLTR